GNGRAGRHGGNLQLLSVKEPRRLRRRRNGGDAERRDRDARPASEGARRTEDLLPRGSRVQQPARRASGSSAVGENGEPRLVEQRQKKERCLLQRRLRGSR